MTGPRKMPWYPQWADKSLSDEALQMCSLEARGVFADLRDLSHKTSERGYLVHADGTPWTEMDIARIVSGPERKIRQCLHELCAKSVVKRSKNGAYYVPFMVRHEQQKADSRTRKARSRQKGHADVTRDVTQKSQGEERGERRELRAPPAAQGTGESGETPPPSIRFADAKLVSSFERWKGDRLTTGELSQVRRLVTVYEHQAIEVRGSPVEPEVMLDRAVGAAIESGASYDAWGRARKYIIAVMDRCIRGQCWPEDTNGPGRNATGSGNRQAAGRRATGTDGRGSRKDRVY